MDGPVVDTDIVAFLGVKSHAQFFLLTFPVNEVILLVDVVSLCFYWPVQKSHPR